MPFSGVNVNNPQSQVSSTPVATETGGINFGGNILGSPGASTASTLTPTGTFDFSTILLYGAIALVVIFVLKQIGKGRE